MPYRSEVSYARYATCITIPAFLFFLFWLTTVILPIAVVETRYQYKRILREVFQTSDIRGVFLPTFRIDLTGFTSRNTVNGITIPALFVDEPVIYNVDPNDERAYNEALRHGIAHASGTSFPGSGGTGYFFAHSSTPSAVRQLNAVFYLLGKLNIGDDIYIWHEGKRGEYKVFKKTETDPGDVSFLSEKFDSETIVFQTCWPPGSTARRLLIFANLTNKPISSQP